MGFLSRLGSFFQRSEPQNAVTMPPEMWEALQGNGGAHVSWRDAVGVSAVLACARIYANDLATVPWKIMQDTKDGKKIEAKDHRYYDLISYRPNSWQTSFEFRQTIGMHLALEGNAFVWLDRVAARDDKIVGMLPLEPSWVSVCRDERDWGRLKYKVHFPNGQVVETDSRFIWHIRNLSWNGYSGMSALQYARDAIRLANDISKSQSDTHKMHARPSGVLSIDQTLDKDQFKKMRALIDLQVQTRLARGLPMVVDKTMKWEQLAQKATDMQTVESRQQIVEEVAVHMGILPAMAGFHSEGSQSYASVEQLLIRHNIHFKQPLLTNFMQSADRWLLSPQERSRGYYYHMVDQAILRGDIKARGEFYRLMWMIGVMSRNEIRRFEDMDPVEGGDFCWAPLANAPVGPDGMHIIQNHDGLDNNLRIDAEEAAARIDAMPPMSKQRAIAILKILAQPEEGESNL